MHLLEKDHLLQLINCLCYEYVRFQSYGTVIINNKFSTDFFIDNPSESKSESIFE